MTSVCNMFRSVLTERFLFVNTSRLHTYRKGILILFTLLIAAFTLIGCDRDEGHIIIKNAHIIDVNTGEVTTSQDIEIVDDLIFRIAEDIAPKGNDKVIDASGKYVIPGLWDMHVHLESWGYEPMVNLMVANGVLGVRDMGSNSLARVDSLKAELGYTLPPMRVIRPGRMLDGPTDNWPYRITVADSAEAVAAVTAQVERGVDFIKVHQQLSKESFMAIAAYCKAHGVPFSGHVPLTVSGVEASEAGMASIEHLTGNPWCGDSACAAADEVMKVYKDNDTYQTPTLTIYQKGKTRAKEGLISEAMKPYLNEVAAAEWAKQDSINDKLFPPELDKQMLFDQMAENSFRLATRMFKEEIPVLAGTDAGFVGVMPGFDLHEELRLMVEEAGATPLQALQSATLTPAVFLKLDNLGGVAAGNYADLLILDKNPLDDIKATRSLYMVISNGEVFDGPKLEGLKQKNMSSTGSENTTSLE